VFLRATLQPEIIRRLRSLHEQNERFPSLEVVLDDGSTHAFGTAPFLFRLIVRDPRGLMALASLDELAVCEAYIAGSLDLEGSLPSLFSVRQMLQRRDLALAAWHKYVAPLLIRRTRLVGRSTRHDEEQPDFHLRFLGRHRCYSHGIFEREDEPLDVAIERKLDFALSAVGATRGQRILDVGAGWGSMTEYAGRRGIRVTSLTVSGPSERFVRRLVADHGLPCRVVREALYEYEPKEKFDAIVNLGATEHLPDYAATLATYRRLLKPGGKIYIDAASVRREPPPFACMLRGLLPGHATPLCLHAFLRAVARTPFELLAIHNDRTSYSLTCRRWVENLEGARAETVGQFGQARFRRFQISLWGCVDGFDRDVLGAYRLVLQLPDARYR
jgi:cyclopropane-fatty-acyl-phospholipid synthase